MNCSLCQALLSAYVDNGLAAGDRAGVDVHLRDCQACRALLQDLSAVRAAAHSLEPLTPSPKVWYQIAAATAATSPGAGSQFHWFAWRPLTALAMAAVIALGLWRVGVLLGPPAAPRFASQSPRSEVATAAEISAETEADYTVAIAQLQEVTAADRDALDPETAGAIDAGLVVIDRAITESRAALDSEPESAPAQESLFAALRRKVALLQEMLALINEMRKGNQDAAARILSEINR